MLSKSLLNRSIKLSLVCSTGTVKKWNSKLAWLKVWPCWDSAQTDTICMVAVRQVPIDIMLGTVYLWEMPSGILLKKKNMHTGAIVAIVPYSNNHVISASKTEVKIWSLSSLLIEEDNSPALKQYTSVLDILAVSLSRNVIAVLTHKNLTLFNGSLTSQPK